MKKQIPNGIFNTLQRVGFTSELYLFYGALQSVDLQVKNTCKGGRYPHKNGGWNADRFCYFPNNEVKAEKACPFLNVF